MAAFAALCFSLTARAQGPVVASDKDDYSPGEIALFSATGFGPGEVLDFSVAVGGDDGTWVPDIAWTDIPADNSGNAEVDYVVPDSWANKTLQLTVMGLTSGLVATTTFTDDPVHNVNFSTSGLPAGTSITVSGSKTTPSGHAGMYSDGFITPASSVDEGTQPSSELSFAFTPTNVPGMGGQYILTSFSLVLGSSPGTLTVQNVANGSGGYDTGGENTGSGGTHSTIVATYNFVPNASPTPSVTPSATPCQNNPPVISCASPTPNADLGQVVGCLGTGTGFGQTFPVTYSVDDQDTTTATVKAHITKPDSSVVDATLATVTDPDGNTVHVTLSNGTTSLTISGPGSASASFSVDIHADDSQSCNNIADSNCGGDAAAQIAYGFNGFFPPLSNIATTKVKQGSAVPVKFQLTDCSGMLITPTNMPGDGSAPTVGVVHVSGVAPSGTPSVDDAGNSNGDTDFCRYDPTGMQWIFNLKTNNTYYVGNTYKIQVFPNDGSEHDVLISIK